MNNTVRWILGITGVGIIAASLFRYYSIQKNLLSQFTYNVISVKFSNVTLEDISADLTIRLNNIADFELTVSQFYVDVYINGVRVGYAQDNGSFLLAAKGFADIPVSVKFNPQIIFQNILDLALFSSKTQDMAVSLRGYAQISSGVIKATVPVDYDSTVKQIMSQ